jgi:putative flavoprotein involved in K+ transport
MRRPLEITTVSTRRSIEVELSSPGGIAVEQTAVQEIDNVTRVQTIVIGGGQAGLCVGYYLRQQQVPFLILDAHQHVGDAWRNRWDSLRLFTPSRYMLPGLRLAARGNHFPTKDQLADYLAQYARKFSLPVKNGIRVDRLRKIDGRFILDAGKRRFECQNVIIAMANYQEPHLPAFAAQLSPDIVQMHSHHYRNPSQLNAGKVLVVGLGNSGADIAMELSRSHATIISGKEPGHIPWPIDTFFARNVAFRLIRFIGHHILSVNTSIGRKARPKLLHRATSLIRVKPDDLAAAGCQRVPKTMGVLAGRPLLEDGRTLDVQNVIWCTGYRHGFPWIDLPIFDQHGDPHHEQGVVPSVSGLYFVGLHFLSAMSSASLVGVGRDAKRIARHVVSRSRCLQAQRQPGRAAGDLDAENRQDAVEVDSMCA